MNDQAPLGFPLGLCPHPSSQKFFSTVLEEFILEFNLHSALPKGKRPKHQGFAPISRWCCAISPPEVSDEDLPPVADIEDLDGAVRGAGGQAGAVVIHLCIVLWERESCAQHGVPGLPPPLRHGCPPRAQRNRPQQPRHATQAMCFPSRLFSHQTNVTQKESREFWATTTAFSWQGTHAADYKAVTSCVFLFLKMWSRCTNTALNYIWNFTITKP